MILFWNCCTIEVRKEATIRKRYNQVPNLTQDTTWESNKTTINITNKSQQVSQKDKNVNMNKSYIYQTTIYSILTQMYVYLVLFTFF